MRILITGAAGFIGFHCCKTLLGRGHEVVGADSLNDYYDPALKEARLEILQEKKGFTFEKIDLAVQDPCKWLFEQGDFEVVLHLAAQAGVRYSLENPQAYVDSNLTAFVNVLEGCRHGRVDHLVYASSSSVYGGNVDVPFSETDPVNTPVSLYAATKRANELIAHSYNHLFSLPCTGLRFFTVYGPWGRPDMAYFSFTKKILAGESIDVFGHGEMWRDFTYVDDVVEAVVRIVEGRCEIPNPKSQIPIKPQISNLNEVFTPEADKGDQATHRIYNIGNNRPEKLTDFIELLEKALGRKAKLNFLPMQPGDVKTTCADIGRIEGNYGFRPATPLAEGLERFVEWYRGYYRA